MLFADSISAPAPAPPVASGRCLQEAKVSTAPRQVGFRLYLCLSTLLIGVLGLQIPERMYPHAVDSWLSIYLVHWALTIGAVTGILDVVVNDLLDDRFTLQVASHWREMWYLVIAMLYLSLLFMAAKVHAESAHMIQHVINVMACVWIAVFDVQYRYVRPRERALE